MWNLLYCTVQYDYSTLWMYVFEKCVVAVFLYMYFLLCRNYVLQYVTMYEKWKHLFGFYYRWCVYILYICVCCACFVSVLRLLSLHEHVCMYACMHIFARTIVLYLSFFVDHFYFHFFDLLISLFFMLTPSGFRWSTFGVDLILWHFVTPQQLRTWIHWIPSHGYPLRFPPI